MAISLPDFYRYVMDISGDHVVPNTRGHYDHFRHLPRDPNGVFNIYERCDVYQFFGGITAYVFGGITAYVFGGITAYVCGQPSRPVTPRSARDSPFSPHPLALLSASASVLPGRLRCIAFLSLHH